MEEEYSEISEEWVTGKKKKRRIAILSIIIALILISSYFLLTMDDHPDTPEAVLLAYAEGINNNDPNEAFELTTLIFTDRLDDYVEKSDWIYVVHVTYHNLVLVNSSDLNETERTTWEEQIDKLENDWDVEVEEYCLVSFDIFAQWTTGETEEMTGRTGCFKIDSKWYLHWA